MNEAPALGKLCDDTAMRDAIHLAVAPVIAGQNLLPGQRVGLNIYGEAVHGDYPIGIVDPFLTKPVDAGVSILVVLDLPSRPHGVAILPRRFRVAADATSGKEYLPCT